VTSKNIVVLISGNGSNLQAIMDYKARNYKITCVVSDQEKAYGLSRAKIANIPTQTISSNKFSKKEFDALLLDILIDLNPDLIVLAGFMKILNEDVVNAFNGKIINIHPSLLPKYKGLHTHRKALEAQDKYHGATVHCVTKELDAGPILGQCQLLISKDDTEATLKEKVHNAEHILYPLIIEYICNESISITNNQPKVIHKSKDLQIPININL
jgi:phosphoribosylglycinamide formyltransferase-1